MIKTIDLRCPDRQIKSSSASTFTIPNKDLISKYVKQIKVDLQKNQRDIDFFLRSFSTALVFENAFDVSQYEVPESPDGTFETPWSTDWSNIGNFIIGAINAMDLTAVSYQSENKGELLQSLSIWSGDGTGPEKSRKQMRGHTDACSFPLPGESSEDKGFSCSPDYVVLVGIRNPEMVSTRIKSISKIFDKLKPHEIEILRKPLYSISTQKSYQLDHIMLDAPLIVNTTTRGSQMRFSHKNVVTDIGEANDAIESFILATEQTPPDEIVVKPGSIVFVNNRTALHGRGTPGDRQPFGRWLLRTYANHVDTPVNILDNSQPWILGPKTNIKHG